MTGRVTVKTAGSGSSRLISTTAVTWAKRCSGSASRRSERRAGAATAVPGSHGDAPELFVLFFIGFIIRLLGRDPGAERRWHNNWAKASTSTFFPSYNGFIEMISFMFDSTFSFFSGERKLCLLHLITLLEFSCRLLILVNFVLKCPSKAGSP